MRKKWNKRVLAAVMAAAMILGTSTTAFANASPPEGQEAAQEQSASAGENGQTENVPADAATETPQTEPVLEEDGTGGTAFTTPGNAQVQDDITEDGSKEFLTITTKNNNTFYLVIDRSASTENVYLLSQIDENDLQEFLKDGAVSVSEKQEPAVVLEEESQTGASAETGQEKETAVEEEPEEEVSGNAAVLIVIFLAAGAGIAAYYFLKIRKKKAIEEEEDEEGLELDDGLETVDEREETTHSFVRSARDIKAVQDILDAHAARSRSSRRSRTARGSTTSTRSSRRRTASWWRAATWGWSFPPRRFPIPSGVSSRSAFAPSVR